MIGVLFWYRWNCMLCMYVYGCLCGVLRLRPVGEIHVVIQEEEGRWRLKFTEGSACKASIAWDHPCYLFTFNHLIHIACVYLVANKDILDIWYLVPWYLWGVVLDSMMLVLNYNHDLITWLMIYAINTKRCFLATWNKGLEQCFYDALDSSP